MELESILNQLGYKPNDALREQLRRTADKTVGYEKIAKHIMDLHEHLKVNNSFVALSNSYDCFKIKIETTNHELELEAHEKIRRFSEKFKVKVDQLDNKKTYYIVGFEH